MLIFTETCSTQGGNSKSQKFKQEPGLGAEKDQGNNTLDFFEDRESMRNAVHAARVNHAHHAKPSNDLDGVNYWHGSRWQLCQFITHSGGARTGS